MIQEATADSGTETRNKIVVAAARLFAEQGYENTPLSQVAREATVSKALIFWHFDNKEKLYQEALRRTLEPYFINVAELHGLSAAAQIERLIDLFHQFVRDNGYSVRFLFGLVLQGDSHTDEVLSRVNELYRVFRVLLADIIQHGQQSGCFRKDLDPQLDASLILAALDGILIEHFMSQQLEPDAGRLVDHLKRVTVRRLTV